MAAPLRNFGVSNVGKCVCYSRRLILQSKTVSCEQSSSHTYFGGILKKFRKKQNVEGKTDKDEKDKRPRQSHFDGVTVSENLENLKKRTSTRTVQGYTPPEDVDTKVKEIVESIYGDVVIDDELERWRKIQLTNRIQKYELLTKAIEEFARDIPNLDLNKMNTVQDVIQYFETEVQEKTAFQDLQQQKLPPNLKIVSKRSSKESMLDV